MTSKIQSHHLQRLAYVYIRQSTAGQVRQHRESTERQYALKTKAFELGWPVERIRVLDGDLGMSGSQSATREDFKTLVTDVSMGKVGAVFALEASRLARSCADWHRLLELCSLTAALIIDEDGYYDLSDFNDQLLLGLKGTMSQAELHFIRARLHGGKVNKAKKGELRLAMPTGLCYNDQGCIVLDPDAEVRGALEYFFASFRETGSMHGIVDKFRREGLQFPKRVRGGVWNGKVIWDRLRDVRALWILKNPLYAGAYVFGRSRRFKEVSPEGDFRSIPRVLPMDEWMVNIQDNHKGYITWEEFLGNRSTLAKNRTNGEKTVLGGPAREGQALLNGLLLCGKCGRRLFVRYYGDGGIYSGYVCCWRKREGLSARSCITITGRGVDDAVSRRAMEVIRPEQIKVALAAVGELKQREGATEKQWQMRIERAEYDAGLAQRRYEEVDPSNRLVAATLEERWNEALVRVEEHKGEYAKYRESKVPEVTPDQQAKMLCLAKDLPRLWNAPTTQPKDRKRILRLLIKDITVERLDQPKKIALHVRWHGGACEDILLDFPLNIWDRMRHSEEIVKEVRQLACKLLDKEIADVFNERGLATPKGKRFTDRTIAWIRHSHSIPYPDLKEPDELTVKEICEKFCVNRQVVYYWIQRNILSARRIHGAASYWIKIDAAKEQELRQWVQNSTQIRKWQRRHGKYSESSM